MMRRGLKRVWIVAALGLAAFLLVAAQGKYEKGAGSSVFPYATTSGANDSLWCYDTLKPALEIKGWNSVHFKFTLKFDTAAAAGLGLKDTGRIWVQTFRNGAWAAIDSTSKGTAAAATAWTFNKRWADDIGDTLLGESLRVVVKRTDTIADTVRAAHDSLAWEWYLK